MLLQPERAFQLDFNKVLQLRDNKNWLTPEYFGMLSKHGVPHIYNSWTYMPPVSEQLKMTGSLTNPRLTGARFLLTPGNTYENAVKAYSPYKETSRLTRMPGKRRLNCSLVASATSHAPKPLVISTTGWRATRWRQLRQWLREQLSC